MFYAYVNDSTVLSVAHGKSIAYFFARDMPVLPFCRRFAGESVSFIC